MGMGLIKSGGADGFYSVELKMSREAFDKKIESLNAKIAELEDATDELVILQRNSYIKKRDYLLSKMPGDPVISAWCADLTENISGVVGLIEVSGERGIVQIQPGYENNAIYNSVRDGQLQHAVAGTPAQTFYNLAMLPAWQKWKPFYRHGIISNINYNNNTCDVILYNATSSQQNLNINQEAKLTDVTISYMSCNASAFENGDHVLVKFENQNCANPVVVGFKENPVACGFQIKLNRGDGELITQASGLIDYIRVYKQDGNPVAVLKTYNIETGYWDVQLAYPEYADPDGLYWIEYSCTDGISTQYPYIYKDSEKRSEDDLIRMSRYEDTIPYWNVRYITDVAEAYDPDVNYPIESWCPYFIDYYRWNPGFVTRYVIPDTLKKNLVEVKSSITYQVSYSTYAPISTYTITTYATYCTTEAGCTYIATNDTGEIENEVSEATSEDIIDNIEITNPSVSGTMHWLQAESQSGLIQLDFDPSEKLFRALVSYDY